MLEREETHVEQIREKDAHYSMLVEQLKNRIDELEQKLDLMAKQRTMVVEGELSDLREQLAQCTQAKKKNQQQLINGNILYCFSFKFKSGIIRTK